MIATIKVGITATGVAAGSVLSEHGLYRYELTRTWDPDLPVLGWVMLNPSTADHTVDDPTIRRCVAFARRWGYGGIIVRNLFALRTSQPSQLLGHPDPAGPLNSYFLSKYREQDVTVVAWGAHRAARDRPDWVDTVLTAQVGHVFSLGVTQSGQPRHPLYVPSSRTLRRWPPAPSALGVAQ